MVIIGMVKITACFFPLFLRRFHCILPYGGRQQEIPQAMGPCEHLLKFRHREKQFDKGGKVGMHGFWQYWCRQTGCSTESLDGSRMSVEPIVEEAVQDLGYF